MLTRSFTFNPNFSQTQVLYLGKIKSVSHRKAPQTFIDDVLEKFRAHNELEQQKRQMSLPFPASGSAHLQMSRIPRPTSMNDMGDGRDTHDFRHMFTRTLVGTQEEEESGEIQPTLAKNDNTLAILKQTEEVLKSLSDRIAPENVRIIFP